MKMNPNDGAKHQRSTLDFGFFPNTDRIMIHPLFDNDGNTAIHSAISFGTRYSPAISTRTDEKIIFTPIKSRINDSILVATVSALP